MFLRSTLIMSSLLAGLSAGAQAQELRSIALILDASGSMNARLPAGGTRIEAAKAAVSAFVGKLDPNLRIATASTATSRRRRIATARTPN